MSEHHDARLARSVDDFRALTAGGADWFIRSAVDMDQHLDGPDGVLAHVPAPAVATFKASVTFARGGLAHADYSSLVDHLTLRQFQTLFARFGIGRTLLSEYNDKYCSNTGGSHICDNQAWHLCTSNCGY